MQIYIKCLGCKSLYYQFSVWLVFAYQQTGSVRVMTVRVVTLVLMIDGSDIVDLTAMCFMCSCGPFVNSQLLQM